MRLRRLMTAARAFAAAAFGVWGVFLVVVCDVKARALKLDCHFFRRHALEGGCIAKWTCCESWLRDFLNDFFFFFTRFASVEIGWHRVLLINFC